MSLRHLILWLLITLSGHTETFGNLGIELPHLGLTLLDSSFIHHKKPWGINNQWFLGTSLTSAINYRFFWVAETSIGLGKMNQPKDPYLSSLQAGGGIKYFFQENNLKPYTQVNVHYLQFLGEKSRLLPLDTSWPIWVGPKVCFGLEWSFFSEMALNIEANYAFLLNINEPFRHTISTKLAYMIYF